MYGDFGAIYDFEIVDPWIVDVFIDKYVKENNPFDIEFVYL